MTVNAGAGVAGGALALAADPSVIERAADPGEFIIQACERARIWLREALEHGDIDQIAECRSQAEAIRVYTMSRQLGKDAQLSAAEVVRRAERGIGVAIRKGQEGGSIRRQGQGGGQPPLSRRPRTDATRSSPADHAGEGRARADTYALADGVPDEEFEEALAEARAEGNLARANVVRKVRGRHFRAPGPGRESPEPADRSPQAAARRRELIGELAASGMSSRQIGERLGIGGGRVRQVAREHGIGIRADAVVGRSRRLDPNRIARETVHALEGLAMGVELAGLAEIDPAEAPLWAASLRRSLGVLRRFARQIEEVTA